MKPSTQSKLPPALRPPVKPAPEGWEPMKPGKPLNLPAALRPQTPVSTPTATATPTPTPKVTGGTIAPTTTTKTPSPPNPRIAALEGRISLLEGTFIPEGGQPFTVSTALTGNGAQDKASLVAIARKLQPKVALRLASTRIFTRSIGAPATFPSGATFGQLFGEPGSDTETGVEVGSVFFQGERCQVVLRNLRSRNCVTLALRPPGGNQIVFSNQIGAGRLAKELAYVVKEILGNESRELDITLKEAK